MPEREEAVERIPEEAVKALWEALPEDFSFTLDEAEALLVDFYPALRSQIERELGERLLSEEAQRRAYAAFMKGYEGTPPPTGCLGAAFVAALQAPVPIDLRLRLLSDAAVEAGARALAKRDAERFGVGGRWDHLDAGRQARHLAAAMAVISAACYATTQGEAD